MKNLFKINLILLSLSCVLFIPFYSSAQVKSDKGFAFDQNAKMGRGVNIIGYDPIWDDLSKARMQAKHFKMIKEAGFDNVRIKISPFRFSMDDAFTINPKFFTTLDWAIKESLKNNLMPIVDFHEHGAMGKDPIGTKPMFLAMWKQIAEHCKDYPNDVLFEIANEPNMKPEIWNDLLNSAYQIIRATNPNRTLIIGTINGNQIKFLKDLELPENDRNIIVAIHYYSPIQFTHQGAPWSVNNKDLSGITWTATPEQKAAVNADFDEAQKWALEHNRPLTLGEFGAYEKGDLASRVRWTDDVARQAEARNWSWSYWQFDSDFILYDMAKDAWVTPIKNALIPLDKSTLLQNPSARKTQTLDGTWQIIVDPLENGYYNHRFLPKDDGYFMNAKMKSPSDLIEYDFDSGDELKVPGDWNTQTDKLYYYEGTVWYKRSFDFNKSKNESTYLYFGAVNYDAKVYLNGEFIGSHIGGYTPFQFDVTDKLKAKDNFLVVKVDNKRKREAVPTVNTDWWNYGGITRSVNLISVPKQHIDDYSLQLAKGSFTNLKGWISVENTTPGDLVTVAIPELKLSSKFKVDTEGKAYFEFTAKPQLWSPKNPKLYQVNFMSSQDTVKDQIGFRTIETKGSKILLNGQNIFLKGISIHEEAPFKTGRVTSVEECRILLTWAKELGCNYVRLAHYPHSEAMVREAEKMGLMIWSEIPVYWTVLYENLDTYKNAEQQLISMISRDKNRAAVILWSIANETPVGESRNVFLGKLAKKARALDNTRLIAAALDTQGGKEGEKVIDDPLGEVVDVIGINNYCGWYAGEPYTCPDIIWKNNYNKPMIMSEVGAGALQGLHGEANERWTEEYQDEVYKQNIKMLRNIDFLAGVSPWILMDFRSARRPLKRIQNDFNRKGLISEQGIKKKAFYTLQQYYLKENN